MEFDALLLSRLQFAFTVAFHILFPSLTIGLASFLLVLEVRWIATGDRVYEQLYRFWLKLFALAFGLGVVTGLVLSYEIGTNWGRFSAMTGNVIGPLMGYEVLSAFFLEAGFLGVMIFGINRVGKYPHLFATAMVSLGTLVSMFWILSANSWMHTPAGYALSNGKFIVMDWWTVIFNPSFPYRLAHMATATFLSSAMFVSGVSAWYLLHNRHTDFASRGLSLAMWMLLVAAPSQVFIGDLHGLNTLKHQPMKVAAMEGNWTTMRGMPLMLFAIPDQDSAKNHFEIGIPRLGSFILKHDLDGEVPGLDQVAPEDRPPVAIVFYSFRLMIGLGVFMVLLAFTGLFLRLRGKLQSSRLFHRLCVLGTPAGFVAILAGWVVTEVGRQPWTVHGLLRTRDSTSLVGREVVATSLGLFVLVYGILMVAFLFYLARVIAHGPHDVEQQYPQIAAH
ncbi:cytochrome ubiquinol oxidase subunit I [Bradyrhizobium sp. JYMT SZCCT0180]|uniref:cytochrome ubiquinol oxidase subunit I n=1 Tax=Bradyrhizobium sp. JYMT SZCCT0180 TaxID=2807666 RepID=UPI001BADC14E|nr:cytochrome ubiquinol oxidase subunit I [Bradyrhizobium sp. JYMT SZCCT0180]